MATLGQELREERERRAVSLKEISDKTKINSRLLLALENDRWEEMPPQLFLKGLIKSYCRTIDADPGTYLAKYDEQRGLRAEVPEKGKSEAAEEPRMRGKIKAPRIESPAFRSRRRVRRSAITLILVVLAAVSVAAWIWLRPGKGPPPRIKTPAIFQEIPKVTPPNPGGAPDIPERKPSPPETGLRLEFRFRADSWMHVTADGRIVLDGTRPAGSTANLRAEKEFILQTGNAGGFDLLINGRPARALGAAGAVLTDIRINTATLATFTKEDKRPEPGSPGR
jgi:cytoskeleton protein RodZ